jgi:hypothetical protein
LLTASTPDSVAPEGGRKAALPLPRTLTLTLSSDDAGPQQAVSVDAVEVEGAGGNAFSQSFLAEVLVLYFLASYVMLGGIFFKAFSRS